MNELQQDEAILRRNTNQSFIKRLAVKLIHLVVAHSF